MNSSRLRVAIVDDEESVRRAVARLIRSAGMDAEVFASGEEFLSRLALVNPDCLVLDLHLPGLSGFEVQARLWTSRLRLPIIVMTGHDTLDAEEQAIRAGAASYLRKPVNKQTLLEAIFGAVGRQAPE